MGAAKSPGGASIPLNGDIYQQDGDYIKDIEINDLRNRYTLTKGATQKMVIMNFLSKTDLPRRLPLEHPSKLSKALIGSWFVLLDYWECLHLSRQPSSTPLFPMLTLYV